MDSQEFLRRVRRLHLLQSLRITFAKGRNGIIGLSRLYRFVENGQIRLADDRQKIYVLAVISSGDWGNDPNRTFEFYRVGTLSDEDLQEIARDVDGLGVADHGAKGLMSGREKMRDQAAAQIIQAVLTPAFTKEIEGWGFKAVGQLLGWHNIPCVEFRLSQGNELAFSSTIVDGWSGRMAVQGNLGDELYVSPGQVQKLIRIAAEAKAEALTAAV